MFQLSFSFIAEYKFDVSYVLVACRLSQTLLQYSEKWLMKINDKDNDEMKDWKDADSSLSAIPRSTFGLAVLFSWKFVFIISLNSLSF